MVDAIEYLHKENPGSIEDETDDETTDNHIAETATVTVDREIDYTLEENSENVLLSIDGALERIQAGTYGTCLQLRQADRRRPARSDSVGDALHRLQAAGGARLSEPAPRNVDVRVGSSTDALTPLAGARRSLHARTQQWIGLLAIALAALAGDQLTKHIVVSHLSLDAERHVAGPLSIHHVQNSGIAFGLFARATPVVTILTALAVAWMLVFFARSGSRHPILPVALGLLIGGSASNLLDRIRLGHVTDFIDLRYWPAFNLADSFIVLGVLVLLAALLLPQRPHERPRPVPDARA